MLVSLCKKPCECIKILFEMVISGSFGFGVVGAGRYAYVVVVRPIV